VHFEKNPAILIAWKRCIKAKRNRSIPLLTLKGKLKMSNSIQLQRYDGENGVEILIDSATGESFCSVKGYARMAGKAPSTIRERLGYVTEVSQGGREEAVKTAEILTAGGLQAHVLITEDQIVQWLPNDNPAAASALLKLGVRMGLHRMAGYSISSTATTQAQPIVNPLDAQIQRALALAGSPGALAIDTFKMLINLDHMDAPTPSTTPPTQAPTPTQQNQGATMGARRSRHLRRVS
jgi:hypothetical protein